LKNKIKQLLLIASKSDFTENELESYISEILQSGKWEDVRDCILSVLYEDDKSLWYEAIRLIYYLQNRSCKFDEVQTIALLYDCLCLSDDIDSNLVWTITRNIKSLSYLSDYDPFDDDNIVQEMEKIKKIRKKDN